MPDPAILRRLQSQDVCWVLRGSRVLFAFDPADTGMRHLAIVALSNTLGWGRMREVAELFDVTPEHVSRLRTRARTEGSAGLVRRLGRPVKLTEDRVRQARAWAGQQMANKEIARRLDVHPSQITRLLRRNRPIAAQDELDLGTPATVHDATVVSTDVDDEDVARRDADTTAGNDAQTPPAAEATTATSGGEAGAGVDTTMDTTVDTDEARGPVEDIAAGATVHTDTDTDTDSGSGSGNGVGLAAPAGADPTGGATAAGVGHPCVAAPWRLSPTRLSEGVYPSRYAGAALLHAFYHRVNAAGVLAAASVAEQPRYDDVALLTATSLSFILGAATVEQTKHLPRADLGVLAGLARIPELRTLRPRLAAIAEACDPLALQRALATAMLDADAPYLPVYFVDDHFMPYEGDKPVGKGWNTKRRHAQKGHADTPVIDYHGRVVCFITGEPSGLTRTLPPTMAQLRLIVGPDAPIMVGFDRGGSYPQVFTACRAAGIHWLTYRRGEPTETTAEPRRFMVARPDGSTEAVLLADEIVTLDRYGQCRQITLFEDGAARLQILTSDTSASASALLAWLRCRWRIENVLKYLVRHLGIDALCDYGADLHTNTAKVPNPARAQARANVKAAATHLADTERALAQLLNSDLNVADTNKAIPAAQKNIATAKQNLATATATLKPIPAKVPANTLDPNAQRALLHTGRRTLQMVLRLLAYNAEFWLSDHLNAYLRDNNEFRGAARNMLHLGGTLTYTPTTITVTLDRPATPKLTNALRLLLDELNATPPRMPGDHRPITYQLSQN